MTLTGLRLCIILICLFLTAEQKCKKYPMFENVQCNCIYVVSLQIVSLILDLTLGDTRVVFSLTEIALHAFDMRKSQDMNRKIHKKNFFFIILFTSPYILYGDSISLSLSVWVCVFVFPVIPVRSYISVLSVPIKLKLGGDIKCRPTDISIHKKNAW